MSKLTAMSQPTFEIVEATPAQIDEVLDYRDREQNAAHEAKSDWDSESRDAPLK